jgi:hypothetical protein
LAAKIGFSGFGLHFSFCRHLGFRDKILKFKIINKVSFNIFSSLFNRLRFSRFFIKNARHFDFWSQFWIFEVREIKPVRENVEPLIYWNF